MYIYRERERERETETQYVHSDVKQNNAKTATELHENRHTSRRQSSAGVPDSVFLRVFVSSVPYPKLGRERQQQQHNTRIADTHTDSRNSQNDS